MGWQTDKINQCINILGVCDADLQFNQKNASASAFTHTEKDAAVKLEFRFSSKCELQMERTEEKKNAESRRLEWKREKKKNEIQETQVECATRRHQNHNHNARNIVGSRACIRAFTQIINYLCDFIYFNLFPFLPFNFFRSFWRTKMYTCDCVRYFFFHLLVMWFSQMQCFASTYTHHYYIISFALMYHEDVSFQFDSLCENLHRSCRFCWLFA